MNLGNEEDARDECKYGAECYQKNPAHHKKYKHPWKRPLESEGSSGVSNNKRQKNGSDEETRTGGTGVVAEVESVDSNLTSDGLGITDGNDLIREVRKDERELIIITQLPDDSRTKVKTLFLVDMPDDFFDFYNFCEKLPSKPVRKALNAVGLELVGPFDVLGGNVRDCTQEQALRHYRYFYDPPEFLTVLKAEDKTELHYGYYRDDPGEMPSFVASNESTVGCKLSVVAGNLFGTLNFHIEKVQKAADPFKKMQIQKIQRALDSWTKSKNINLDSLTPEIKARRTKVVARTFHGAGIVVPYSEKTQVGYRELAGEAELTKLFKGIAESSNEDEKLRCWSKLQPVLTNALIANDEGDFGASLELGLNMFCYGSDALHGSVLNTLTTTYDLLGRSTFSEVIKAHLQNRVKGPKVNSIS